MTQMTAITAGKDLAPKIDARPSRLAKAQTFWLGMAGIWLIASLILLVLRWHSIAMHDFWDVDDELRLVEVRDWLAGQSFYDVTQYRMNAPFGAPMHWSRLVDLPLALMIVLLRPFLGPMAAETVTAVTIPLITLGVVMAAVGATARRLISPAAGLLAAAFCGFCVPLIVEVLPLRVDHHGWEIAFQCIALFAALDPQPRRGAVIAGLASAVALQISLESLPFSAAVAAAFGLFWVFRPTDGNRARLLSFVVTLAIAETMLFGLMRSPLTWATGYCDSISPPHILLFGLAALGVGLVTKARRGGQVSRLLGLTAIAICSVAAYRAYPPHCGLDAFSNLEPIVRKLWYERVLEGLPFWDLPPTLAWAMLSFPLIGILCAAYAAMREEGAKREMWILYAGLLGAATLAAALVVRASGFASVAATPAAAWMICRYVPVTRRAKSLAGRVLGTALVSFAFSPAGAVTAVAAFAPADPDSAARHATGIRPCAANENFARLAILPPSRVLAPLDLGPAILFETRLSPLASGHHRNHQAMAQVLTAFTGSADAAHQVVRQRGLSYIILCPDTTELSLYKRYAPGGFGAGLAQGRAPDWLAPVRVSAGPIRVWQVKG